MINNDYNQFDKFDDKYDELINDVKFMECLINDIRMKYNLNIEYLKYVLINEENDIVNKTMNVIGYDKDDMNDKYLNIIELECRYSINEIFRKSIIINDVLENDDLSNDSIILI